MRISAVDVDFAAVIERARKIAMTSRSALDRRMEGSENPKLFRGHARLDGKAGETFRVRIGTEAITARQVVLNTGTPQCFSTAGRTRKAQARRPTLDLTHVNPHADMPLVSNAGPTSAVGSS